MLVSKLYFIYAHAVVDQFFVGIIILCNSIVGYLTLIFVLGQLLIMLLASYLKNFCFGKICQPKQHTFFRSLGQNYWPVDFLRYVFSGDHSVVFEVAAGVNLGYQINHNIKMR